MTLRVGKRSVGVTMAATGGSAPSQSGPRRLETDSGSPWELPERLGQYRLGEVLGQGGMGRVYAAYDVVLEREVALKLLWRTDPTLLVRFLKEAQFQARLDHPNICKIFEVETQGPAPYIVMERIHGQGLLEAELDLALPDLLDVMAQCAEAVHAAHQAGMIHRDLKPGNILLEIAPGGGIRPRLLDFGLAKDLEGPGITVGSRVMGTPAYMAPEQALGKGVSVRSDVYSLGATFYAFLAGQSPFRADSAAELLLKQSREAPPPLRDFNPQVPPGLALILQTCMARDPVLRYGSALALAEDLRRLKAGQPLQARIPLLRRRRAWAAAAAGLLLLLGAGAWAALRPVPPPLAGLRATPERPIRILVLDAGWNHPEAWMARGLAAVASGSLRGRPGVLAVAPEPADAPRNPQLGLATLRTLAGTYAADLILLIRSREDAKGHHFEAATLRTGETRLRPLLQRSYGAHDYLAAERWVLDHLPARLGLTGPGAPVYLARSLENRQALAQAIQLVSSQGNSESDRTAEKLLRRILAAEPEYVDAHGMLASLLTSFANEAAHHGRLDEIGPRLAEATAEATRIIQLNPGQSWGYCLLATALRVGGDLEGAERAAREAIQVAPTNFDAHDLLAIVHNLRPGPGAHRAALAEAHTAIRLRGELPTPHYRLAQIHLDAGQFGPALEAVDRTLALLPTMEYAHLVRSNILIWSGRVPEAEAALKEGLARVPNARLLKRNQVYTAFLARDHATFPDRLAICREFWPKGHPTRIFLEGLDLAFQGRWAQVEAQYGQALAATRAKARTMPFAQRTSASVDLYLMGRVLAGGPRREAAKPFLACADQLLPKRLRLAQRDPAFRGLWPAPEPWPGD